MNGSVAKLIQPSADARRAASKSLGRKNATAREIADHFRGQCVEWRDIPVKLAVMDRLMRQAWELVHRLIDLGVKFAGSPRDATLVIAGTAYAAWRTSLDKKCRAHDPASLALVVAGMNDGLEFALWNKSGIPAMYADEYLDTVCGSDDPIDKFTPIQALAEVWPEWYAGHRIRLAKPRYEEPTADRALTWGLIEELWDHRPNVMTASRGELRRAATAGRAKQRKLMKAKWQKPAKEK